MKNLSLIGLLIIGLSSVQGLAANLCPKDQVLENKLLGTGTFGISGGTKVIGALKEKYEIEARGQSPKVVQDNQDFLLFEAPVFLLEIKPVKTKAQHSCGAYSKTHVFKKVFQERDASDEGECRQEVEGKVSNWVQGTLVGSASSWVGGDTPEGDALFKACPDPCSYSSKQENIYSFDGKTCQIRVQLSVTCGAPKEKNEFEAKGSYLKKAVCYPKTR